MNDNCFIGALMLTIAETVLQKHGVYLLSETIEVGSK